jgi:phosphatidylethanolamine/phosphatidyl-N-methylethanolamine N-methyltransferase
LRAAWRGFAKRITGAPKARATLSDHGDRYMAASLPQRKRHRAEPIERASDRAVFFRNWLQDPFRVAAIAPSGRLLARLMATGLRSGARVVELGAGTGTLTDAIVASGVQPQDLYLVEQNAAFVAILERRFPRATVLHADAAALRAHLGEAAGAIDCVVSGLPLLWFDRDTKRRILGEAFALLRPCGCFHQFTYLGRPPVGRGLLDELGLDAALIGVSPINLPPAFVYRFTRKLHR